MPMREPEDCIEKNFIGCRLVVATVYLCSAPTNYNYTHAVHLHETLQHLLC